MISFYIKDNTNPLQYILDKLLQYKPSEEIQYLIECADWQESNFNKNNWIPMSPIYNSYNGEKWPIYDIDVVFSKESEIKHISWKGDYTEDVDTQPAGNLPYNGETHTFNGEIWTRGE